MNKTFVAIFLLAVAVFPQTVKNPDFSSPVQSGFQKKSVMLAIAYSVLIPGMGELYAGNYSSGKFFTIAEVAFWGTYFGMNTYSNWQKDRYHSYAVSNGGVNLAGKNDDYFANIGVYMNVDEYNDDMARNAEFNKMYNPVTDYWKWTPTDRKTYRAMWTSGEQVHNNLRFVVGAMLINRVISAINAARLAAAYNKNIPLDLGWNVSAGISNFTPVTPSYTVNFWYNL
jgi:hypothetical protein